ncbi:MAG: LemA family protein [Rickettsiales bacterium]|jgi:LemA protein|nr:LemA family protein [Rickettsiales bacterium]
MNQTLWYIVGGLAVIVLYSIAMFNGLISRRNQAREAWATVETQLKRRHDLIPNLVAAVKGAAAHEKSTLDAVVKARNAAAGDHDAGEASVLENNLAGALRHIFALSESYPALRANENFIELQHELADTENKIQASRQFYNTVVMALNTSIEQFPSNIVAGMFGIRREKLFELDKTERAAAEKAPKIGF